MMMYQRFFFCILTVFVALVHGSEDYREEDASEELEYGTILRIIPAPAPVPTKPIQTSALRNSSNSEVRKSAKSSAPLISSKSAKSSAPLISSKSAKSSAPLISSKSAKSSVPLISSKSAKSSVSATGAQGGYSLNSEASVGGKDAKKDSEGGKDPKKDSDSAVSGGGGSGTSTTGKGPGAGNGSTGGSSNNAGESVISVLTIPSFMLTMTKDSNRRRLRTYLDVSITESVLEYLSAGKFESLIGASIEEMTLDIPSETSETVNGATTTLVSVFTGTASFKGDNMVTRDKIIAALTSVFVQDKKSFLQHAAQSENPKFKTIDDVKFALVGGSDGSGYSLDLGGGDSSVEVGTLKAKSSIPMIAGMAAAISILVAAIVYTKKRHRDKAGYELSNDFDNDAEIPQKLKLSDLASGSTQNATGYASLITGVWNSKKYSMSQLAAGATQEDFAQNGMRVDIYGKTGKEKRRRKVSPRANSKGAELITTLDSIQEVRSLSGSESWQDGLEEINKAPPLLPALSVTTSTGSEEDEDSCFGTPRLLDMTGYSNTSGIEASPQLSTRSRSVLVRRLNYSGGESDTDDDLLNPIDLDLSDKSSDGCVKDILKDIDDCSPEKCVAEEKEIEVVPLGFEESAEDEYNQRRDDDDQTQEKKSDFPVKSSLSNEPSIKMQRESCSSQSVEEEIVDLNQQAFESGEVIHNVIFGSDAVVTVPQNPVSESSIVSDDATDESSISNSCYALPSSMSFDGDLTDISISGADQVLQ